jgi:hypothetical protein
VSVASAVPDTVGDKDMVDSIEVVVIGLVPTVNVAIDVTVPIAVIEAVAVLCAVAVVVTDAVSVTVALEQAVSVEVGEVELVLHDDAVDDDDIVAARDTEIIFEIVVIEDWVLKNDSEEVLVMNLNPVVVIVKLAILKTVLLDKGVSENQEVRVALFVEDSVLLVEGLLLIVEVAVVEGTALGVALALTPEEIVGVFDADSVDTRL